MGEKRPIKFSLTTSTEIVRNFFTCRKSATWDRRLYFPSEGRRAEEFFARKIPQPGLNPRTRVPEASTLTTRPPKPLMDTVLVCMIKLIRTPLYDLIFFRVNKNKALPVKQSEIQTLCCHVPFLRKRSDSALPFEVRIL
jgi:hypothetical protein